MQVEGQVDVSTNVHQTQNFIGGVRHAREYGRGRDLLDVEDIDAEQAVVPEVREDLVALDEALTKLNTVDPKASQLVQLRYFAGLSIPDAARTLDISPRTADRLWSFARAWLLREIGSGDAPDQSA